MYEVGVFARNRGCFFQEVTETKIGNDTMVNDRYCHVDDGDDVVDDDDDDRHHYHHHHHHFRHYHGQKQKWQ